MEPDHTTRRPASSASTGPRRIRIALALVSLAMASIAVGVVVAPVLSGDAKGRLDSASPGALGSGTPSGVSDDGDPGRIALGVNISNAPDDPARLDAYARLARARPALVMWYQNWGEPLFYAKQMDAVAARHEVPVISWAPQKSGADGHAAIPLRAIAAGHYDAYLRRAARSAAHWGRRFFVRFAPEMNGRWTTWGPGVNGNTPADFVGAWRHVVTIFRQEGASNVRWVWSPNADCNGNCPFTQLYPGDSWVDWVALDGYNPGTSVDEWRSLADVLGPSYATLEKITSKPVMVGETASSEQGGDKAQWIRQGLLEDLPVKFPNVRALVWFDRVKETDWRVNSSAASLAAWRAVVDSDLYYGAANASQRVFTR